MIPRFERIIAFIANYLEELAREDSFRMKKQTDKRQRQKEIDWQERKEKLAKEAEEKSEDQEKMEENVGDEKDAMANVIQEEGDEDIIF